MVEFNSLHCFMLSCALSSVTTVTVLLATKWLVAIGIDDSEISSQMATSILLQSSLFVLFLLSLSSSFWISFLVCSVWHITKPFKFHSSTCPLLSPSLSLVHELLIIRHRHAAKSGKSVYCNVPMWIHVATQWHVCSLWLASDTSDTLTAPSVALWQANR